jgi:lipopolysaccharide transport protein LptA
MAKSRAERCVPRHRVALHGVVLCCVALGSAIAAAAQVRSDDQIAIDGVDLRIDYGRNTLQMRNVVMKNRDGTMLITAQEAKAHSVELSARDMQWDFIGDVHIEVDGATLDAATATVNIKANGLDSAHAVGNPAQFSHLLKGATQRSQGHARNIDYDAGKSQLHLSGAVWYSDGRNDINTSTLNYNLADRSIDSNPGAGERVQLHLQLDSGTTVTKPAPKPAPVPATIPPASVPAPAGKK